jgi:hypothetical protein
MSIANTIVTCMSDSRRGFELEIGFIDNFNTRFVTTLNYTAIADLHTLEITKVHTKSFTACSVFTSRFPVTACNSWDSSASASRHSQLVTVPQLNYSSASESL